MSWSAGGYGRFADERALPLDDLFGSLINPLSRRACHEVLDLGCGSGVALPLIRRHCPGAAITALDSSGDMLAAAGALAGAETRLIQADIARWQPDRTFDLILSNAALHWLDDHRTLFPNLMAWLAPGGILAVQMPNNWAEPSHRLMADIARRAPWQEKLAAQLRQAPVGDMAFYHDLLQPVSQSCRIWGKTYIHKLAGDDAVYRWLEGTSLRPLLEALDNSPDGGERAAFAASYKAALAGAYPGDAAGVTEFSFRRIFIMAIARD